MHILFVTGEYPPMRGGVGAYTAELARALVQEGVQVSVLTGALAADQQLQEESAIAVSATVSHWGWGIARRIQAWAQQQQVDWVHVQYQTAAYAMHPAINLAPWWWRRSRLAPWAGKKTSKSGALRIAWTYHDLLVPYLFPKAGAALRHWVTEQPAAHSDLVVVTNEGDRLRLAAQCRNLVKIPIGSNIEGRQFSAAARQQRRQQRGYQPDDLVIGYFGFLNQSKGGLTLVDALAYLVQQGRNAYLLMIGEEIGASDPTNAAHRQEVAQRIQVHGLTARVQWTGHQSDREVSADLAAIDLLVMPYRDGASLRRGTLMAGLAHGCAIVTTLPQTPLPELADGRDLLYTPPDNAEMLAQTVARLADDVALRQHLQEQARRQSQQFTWQAIARQHLACYAGGKEQGTGGK